MIGQLLGHYTIEDQLGAGDGSAVYRVTSSKPVWQVPMREVGALLVALFSLSMSSNAQVTTGEILGLVYDPSGGAVREARVSVRSLDTGSTDQATTDLDGRFRIPQLPVGSYEVRVEKNGFARYVQWPIVLRLNQKASLEIRLELAGVVETLTVTADAPLINTTNAEVGTNFDKKRISELPLAPGRNILKLVLSVPGVSQLQSNQFTLARSGVDPLGDVSSFSFSVNGMRMHSNGFLIDGQDSNDATVRGLVQSINNPDLIAEFRLITNQFAPEYGMASGAVVNMITKRGTNSLHGTAFWLHNDQHLNSRNNLEKAAKFAFAPWRIENQIGGTLGGPIAKEKTFFFGSFQRWTDRRLGAGVTVRGVPTEEGRAALRSLAGDRETVKVLLEHLPPAQAPVEGLAAPLSVGGRTVSIPLGTLTGSSSIRFNALAVVGPGGSPLQRQALAGRPVLV